MAAYWHTFGHGSSRLCLRTWFCAGSCHCPGSCSIKPAQLPGHRARAGLHGAPCLPICCACRALGIIASHCSQGSTPVIPAVQQNAAYSGSFADIPAGAVGCAPCSYRGFSVVRPEAMLSGAPAASSSKLAQGLSEADPASRQLYGTSDCLKAIRPQPHFNIALPHFRHRDPVASQVVGIALRAQKSSPLERSPQPDSSTVGSGVTSQ